VDLARGHRDSRLANAGTPLGAVLLEHAATGSFATGLMSGAYALAEAAAAPWLGSRLADRAVRRGGHAGLAAALLVRAALFGILAGAPLPTAAFIPITAVAGTAAGTPGSLRTLLARPMRHTVNSYTDIRSAACGHSSRACRPHPAGRRSSRRRSG
jgi:MFS family permease